MRNSTRKKFRDELTEPRKEVWLPVDLARSRDQGLVRRLMSCIYYLGERVEELEKQLNKDSAVDLAVYKTLAERVEPSIGELARTPGMEERQVRSAIGRLRRREGINIVNVAQERFRLGPGVWPGAKSRRAKAVCASSSTEKRERRVQ